MSILADIRKQLMKSTESTEQEILSEGSAITAMWDQIQTLKLEMNAAKKAAAEEAAKPYLEAIEKIERRYAMYLKLQSR
jgi:hypothetical protein